LIVNNREYDDEVDEAEEYKIIYEERQKQNPKPDDSLKD